MEIEPLVTVAPAAAAAGLYVILIGSVAVALRHHRRAPRGAPSWAPRVTVMKPLAGADDDLVGNLESFAAVDYPSFEVLFGVASLADPAAAVVTAFLGAHPELDARLVVTDAEAAMNPKVAQLIGLERHATGEVLVISDSNVRVAPGYLRALIRELEQPGVGLVTSVFVGTGERSIGAALENLQLGAFTAPGVVVSTIFMRRPFTVGKSMAMRRSDAERLGAFRAVGGVLAEDHLLGRIFFGAGLAVRTSLEPVENRNVDCSVRRTLERHARWAKMRRSIAPAAFALEPLASPLAVASIAAVMFPTRLSALCMAVAAVLQTALALASVRALRGRGMALCYAPLEIVRTYLVFACWAWAWLSRRITWRGHAFVLGRDSSIAPAPPRSWSRLRDAVRAWA